MPHAPDSPPPPRIKPEITFPWQQKEVLVGPNVPLGSPLFLSSAKQRSHTLAGLSLRYLSGYLFLEQARHTTCGARIQRPPALREPSEMEPRKSCNKHESKSLNWSKRGIATRSRWPRSQTDLAAGVAVVSSKSEAEVRGAVHAHHRVRRRHRNRSGFTQGHPQLLTGLLAHPANEKQACGGGGGGTLAFSLLKNDDGVL